LPRIRDDTTVDDDVEDELISWTGVNYLGFGDSASGLHHRHETCTARRMMSPTAASSSFRAVVGYNYYTVDDDVDDELIGNR
jgi:hypothetical protein